MMIRTVALAAILALGACASTPDPVTRSYLLTRPGMSTGAVDLALAVGAVAMPAYLQSKDIAVATHDSQLRGARNHQWAEPLAEGIGRYLSLAFEGSEFPEGPEGPEAAAADALLLDLTVLHFHGSEAGSVVLEADWLLRRRGAGEALAGNHFEGRVAQDGVGYDALVDAHRALLDQLVAEVLGAAGGLANQKQSAPSTDAPAMIENASS
jgi:uncharacterized lipoprotein YmbA